jgi:hypothetical protein
MPKRSRTTGANVLVTLAVGGALVGCGGSDELLLGSYLEEFELNDSLEAAAYVPLGGFDVPAAVTIKASGESPSRTIWVGVSFELIAETAPEDEAAVLAAAERRRGALNDALINIIRTSSTDELTDPRLSAVKVRMTEAARPMLGEDRLRHLVFYKICVPVL